MIRTGECVADRNSIRHSRGKVMGGINNKGPQGFEDVSGERLVLSVYLSRCILALTRSSSLSSVSVSSCVTSSRLIPI
ncbi:hypothetical protein NQZ68_015724 [Dissostichus eleginoides]|nr:hypothetical protein NQZ68_015724 [Dissostichus eleginoides]